VSITQIYKNEGKKNLEAIYVFPGSTRAAVHAMRMTIGSRIIEADIMERQAARATYEQAKKEGKTASLLEQERPNVFQMNVANILPGDEIKTEMKYTELLEPEDQVYEFIYPTVVGPRYSNTKAAGAADTTKWVENPYLHSGQGAPFTFGLTLDLQAGLPIAQISSPSHQVAVEYDGKTKAHLSLQDDPKAATKDFVLRYQLAGNQIQTGLLLYPGQEENFFLMMMEPPTRVPAETIVPREYIFIVDVSGSMHGFPLDSIAKPMMREIIGGLRSLDRMNVLLFSGGSAVLAEGKSLPASDENKKKAVAFIDSQQGGGGTEILPALNRALALPRTEGVSRIVVVVTDGFVMVEPEVFELIRKNLGQANLFAFGVGTSVNRFIIEGMARAGLGESFVAINPEEGKKQAAKFQQYVSSPVLTNVSVKFDGWDAYDVEPIAMPDLFALRPVIVFGKYRGQPGGQITVVGKTVGGDFTKSLAVSQGNLSPQNTGLRYLWARHKIRRIADMNLLVNDQGRVKEITELGLKYNLMTQFTSFVAVDKIKRADGQLETVKQPLPLPDGVSDLAVADEAKVFKSSGLMTSSPAPVGGMRQERAMMPSTGEVKKTEATGRNGGKEKMDGPQKDTSSQTKSPITIEEIRGDLSKAEVEKILQARLSDIVNCQRQAKQLRQVDVKGEITLDLIIGSNGHVIEVKLLNSTLTDQATVACLQTILKAIILPSPAAGQGKVTVKITLSSL
ncbi:MAG: AgmX/PglI C-terminal domain-containing protein, partial [Deltaproteobacteria bacterium]|nr:AgmX/PglI C-terminal domain-containing protein [Deltaproteobacteria bacterium]